MIMATAEQLEAWTSDSSKQLSEKIGEHAQVIVMVFDIKDNRYHMETVGTKAGIIYLLETCQRNLKTLFLPPGPTIVRNDV
jgi:hypothetical protein